LFSFEFLVLKTKEALKEEKLQRKEEEKRRFSGNHDFLSSVGLSDNSSQNRKIRFRKTSQTVSECSDTGSGLSPIDAKYKGLRSLTFNMKGDSVRVHLLAQVWFGFNSRNIKILILYFLMLNF
jgi:hypothetical protein